MLLKRDGCPNAAHDILALLSLLLFLHNKYFMATFGVQALFVF